MVLLALYLVLAVGMSFLCSLSESVLLTTRQSHVALLIKSGHRSGRVLKRLKDNIDRSLSAILTVNTVANTAGAALIGAGIHDLYRDVPLTVVSIVLTFLFLIFAEIIPKTIGASKWRQMAPFVAYVIQGMIWVSYPMVLAVEFFSRRFSEGSIYPRMTREEFIVVAEMGGTEGVILEKEARVIRNLLHLNSVLVKDVMTPWSVVFALPSAASVAEVMTEVQKSFFSRIPVYDKQHDQVVGVVFRSKLLQSFADGRLDDPVGSLALPLYAVSENESVAVCLDLSIKRREHLFLVKNQQDRVCGVITLEDAIETLLGVEIVDEVDRVVDMRKLATDSSLKTTSVVSDHKMQGVSQQQLLA